MIQQLGVMLFKEREKMGVTQKNIAEGIISISELCRVERGAVAFLYEAAGTYVESNMMAAYMKSSFQGELVITNELVRDLREAKGLSQEYLCADICSQETLSRIENGKRSPNKKNLYQLLKRMGMERENYYGFIEADDYELYEKVRQYNRCFPKGMREEAMKLLDEIETGVDMKKPVNRQFIGIGRISEQLDKGELSREQAIQRLHELLYLAGDILANLSLVYGKQDLPVVEEKYLRYGYYLICLYDRERVTGILSKAYQEKFHKDID